MWNIPEDDGGSEVTGYIVEKTEYGANDWIACPGYATTTEYLARGLTEGKKYIFRIRAGERRGQFAFIQVSLYAFRLCHFFFVVIVLSESEIGSSKALVGNLIDLSSEI